MTYIASALEICGTALIVYAIWSFSAPLAIATIGFLLIGAGYGMGRMK